MTISVYGPVATGTAFGTGVGTHNIVMPVLMDVPASTDTVGVYLMFCATTGHALDGSIDSADLLDDATLNPLYGSVNKFVSVVGNFFTGHGGPCYTVGGVSQVGASIAPYVVFNELLNGVNSLTYSYTQSSSDVDLHISIFAIVGAGGWQGGCDDAWQVQGPGGTFDSVPVVGNGTDPNASFNSAVDLSPWAPGPSGDLTLGFYMVATGGADAGSWTWVDGAVTVGDQWINEGTYQVNATMGWETVDTTGTVFNTGASPGNPPLVDSEINNWVFLRDGIDILGIPYCTTPGSGDPVFDHRMRMIGGFVGDFAPSGSPCFNARIKLGGQATVF